MKSNGGGYGFENLRTIRGNNDVQLDTGDGLNFLVHKQKILVKHKHKISILMLQIQKHLI